MDWRLKRQLIAIGILGVLAASIAYGLFFWFDIAVPPSDEAKPVEVSQSLRLLWARFFFVRQGVYDVAALLENPNEHARAARVPYVFRLFDENDILIAAKEGTGFVNLGERFVIGEPLIATGVRAPKRVSFEIRDVAWKAEKKTVLPVTIKQKRFEARGSDSILFVTLANRDIKASASLEAVAVLVDEEGNAAAVARAIIDPLVAGEEREVVFTWPRALPEPKTIQVYVRKQ